MVRCHTQTCPKGEGPDGTRENGEIYVSRDFFFLKKHHIFCTNFGHSMQNIGKIVVVDFLKLCASDRGERRRICFYLVATDSPRLAAYTKHTLRTTSSFCCYHCAFLSCSQIKVFQACDEKGQVYFFNALDVPSTLLHHPFPLPFRC